MTTHGWNSKSSYLNQGQRTYLGSHINSRCTDIVVERCATDAEFTRKFGIGLSCCHAALQKLGLLRRETRYSTPIDSALRLCYCNSLALTFFDQLALTLF